MAEQLQVDYPEIYEGLHVQMHQVSQFDDSNALSSP